jgi:hypothetical protein
MSDLNRPAWAVISERGVEETSLTYEEARQLVERLGREDIQGRCIVSDKAAARMNAESDHPTAEQHTANARG